MLFRNRFILRRRKKPLPAGRRTQIDQRPAAACFEWLEKRRMLSSASWVGGPTGYWDVAGNWSSDAVPTSATAVSIPTSGATVTIAPGETDSAASLTIAAGARWPMPAGVNATNPTTNLIVDSDFESPVDQLHDQLARTWWFVGVASISAPNMPTPDRNRSS